MKKFFLTVITIVITAVALSVSFNSCNKDSSSDSSGDSLSGTTWTASPAGWNETYTLKFNTGDSVSWTWVDDTDKKNKETLYGKYSYDGNNIYMEFTEGSESASLYGIVSGNKMVLTDEDGDSLTFTKK